MFGRLSRRRIPFGLFGAVSLLLASVLATSDGHACSCIGPELEVLSPRRPDGLPLNARVRVAMPAVGAGQAFPRLALRVHGGAEVVGRTRVYPDVAESVIELTPTAPLSPSTRYEVAVIDPSQHPSTTVLSTFVTGTSVDTAAPVLDGLGVVSGHVSTRSGGGDCTIPGQWVTIEGWKAHDPGREHPELVFAIWGANAQGILDTNRVPDALLSPSEYNRSITIGRSSLCSTRDFPLKGPIVPLAVAVLDEAGNASAPRRIRVDITRNAP
jgi:hypothetical protein